LLPTEPYPTHTLTSWVPFPNNIRTAIDLSHKHPAHLNRSCPAVSQICSFTVFPPTLTILLPNSTPIVWLESWRTTQTSRRYTLWVKERILKIDRCFAKLSTWVGCLVILRLTVYTAIVNRESYLITFTKKTVTCTLVTRRHKATKQECFIKGMAQDWDTESNRDAKGAEEGAMSSSSGVADRGPTEIIRVWDFVINKYIIGALHNFTDDNENKTKTKFHRPAYLSNM